MAQQHLKLRRIRISGFKALDGFDLVLPKDLTILIGANGSGKSSILQCLSFIPYFTKGNPSSFFLERHWKPTDARSRVEKGRHNITVEVALEGVGDAIYWGFSWSSSREKLVSEIVLRRKAADGSWDVLLAYGDRAGFTFGAPKFSAPEGIKPSGSFLSVLNYSSLPADYSSTLNALRLWGEGVFSLELLSPAAMRGGARGSQTDIGPRGERLGGFLASLPASKKHRLVERLKRFYPLKSLDAVKKIAGWVDLRVAENYRGLGSINATHMSDGFMRLLGLASIPEFGNEASLVLLDEIEDGIEPHILSDFVRLIAEESSAQLLLTSHSPLLVNSFESSEIVFVARNDDGRTLATRFDEISELKKSLEYYGPGEIWAHTNLETISGWIKDIHKDKRKNGADAQTKKDDRDVDAFLTDILDLVE